MNHTDTKDLYSTYIHEVNISGSGKASSYIRALDILSEMLRSRPFGFEDCIDIWNITSLKRIAELRDLVAIEQSKGMNSEWLSGDIAPSYLTKGYCKAALSSYSKYLVEVSQEDALFEVFKQHNGQGADLPRLLDTEPKYTDVLLDGLKGTEGKDVIRSVKTRINQNLFRRMLRDIYRDACCITGLNIPQVNRASHIIPWADDERKRLDPSNGLYLSATYDAAFDQHLISLDDDYRIVLSNDIKERYSNDSLKTYFLSMEGNKITLPRGYLPNKQYLEIHRKGGLF